jgi:hypothetical protein
VHDPATNGRRRRGQLRADFRDAPSQEAALVLGVCELEGALVLAVLGLGMQRHVVKPATVIDWSTSVVGGVGVA